MRLGIVILAVRDVARAARFYREAFDVEQVVDAPSYAELRLPDGMRLGLYQREGFARNTGEPPAPAPLSGVTATELYFYVDEPSEIGRRLERGGARVLSSLKPRDWGDDAAYFADLDGNVIVVARASSAAMVSDG